MRRDEQDQGASSKLDRAETETGSVHESAVGNADAPKGEREQ
ncbi:hypothetical protein [Pelagerythrobacter marinus]|nr:hypothetical protein [Pelagerythrobacter marinus]